MNQSTLGFAAFVAFVLVGRTVTQRAQRTLTTEEKAALIDSGVGLQIYMFAAFLVIVLVASVWPAVGWLVLPLVVAMLVLSYRRVSRARLPAAYRRAFGLHCLLYVVGVAVGLGITYWH